MKTKFPIIASAIFLVALAVGIQACQKQPEPVKVTGVSLDKTSVELTEGDEVTLTATVAPENATNKNVTWISSDEKVAMAKDGKITGVKAGTAKITVKTEDGGKTAECSVIVKAKVISVESVSLDKSSVELEEGEEITLVATVKPDNASNKIVSWSSSDNTIALVENGKISALKAGEATILVKTDDGDKIATCKVNVIAKFIHVESVSLNVTSVELEEGNNTTLSAIISPSNASNVNVRWESNNTAIATVNSSGIVSAVSTGDASITVTTEDGNHSASCSVTVKPKPYPLVKKLTKVGRGDNQIYSFKYDSNNRIIKFETNVGEFYEFNYDNYYNGNGTILMKGGTDQYQLSMENGLCKEFIYGYGSDTFEYDKEHITNWYTSSATMCYLWDGETIEEDSGDFEHDPDYSNTYEYGDVNPFTNQQFNMFEFINECLSGNMIFLFGFGGIEPNKLVTKRILDMDNSPSTYQYNYTYSDGVITSVVTQNGNHQEILYIEYY